MIEQLLNVFVSALIFRLCEEELCASNFGLTAVTITPRESECSVHEMAVQE